MAGAPSRLPNQASICSPCPRLSASLALARRGVTDLAQVSKVRLWRDEGGSLFMELKAAVQRFMDQVPPFPCCAAARPAAVAEARWMTSPPSWLLVDSDGGGVRRRRRRFATGATTPSAQARAAPCRPPRRARDAVHF
jgi:hypothetical protein